LVRQETYVPIAPVDFFLWSLRSFGFVWHIKKMFRQLPRWQPGPAQHLSRGVQEAGPNSIVMISENRINSGLLPVQDPTLPTLISYAACPFRPGEFRVSGAVLLDRCYRRRAAGWGEGGMSEQQLCGADAVERSRGCWGREDDFAVKSNMLVAIL
jgi:hypothetical protein